MIKRSLVILAALLVSSAALAAPVAVGPAATPFTLGQFRLLALRYMVNTVPNSGSVFGKDVGPAAVKATLDADHVDDTTSRSASMRCWYARVRRSKAARS